MAAARLTYRQRRGRAAERWVARTYARRGFTIVERNYRCRRGEIDLIVRRAETLVFVEVRSASTGFIEQPANTVGTHKQARIAAAARRWLASRQVGMSNLRFDVVGVSFSKFFWVPRIEIFENAFTIDSKNGFGV